MGEGNFLRKKFSFPQTPILQKPWNKSFIFLSLFCASIGWACYVCTNPWLKVFVHLFQKVARVWGEKPHNYPSPNAGEGEFLCVLQRKRENPRRGFSLVWFDVFMGEENFLKKAFLPPNPQLSKTLKQRGLGFNRYFVRLLVERRMFAQTR